MLIDKAIIGYSYRGYLIQQFFHRHGRWRYLVVGSFIIDVFQEILVGKVAVKPIAYKQIFPAIIVHIKEKCAPTPAGCIYTSELRYFTEGVIAIIQLQAISSKLMMIIKPTLCILYIIIIKPDSS